MLVNHMAQGLSFESFAGVVGVHRANLYQWAKVHQDFHDAKKRATDAGLLALEQLGVLGMKGELKNFNVTAWIFMMKNRHSALYSDKQEHTITAKPTIIKRLDGSEVVLGLEEGQGD